jgi:cytosine/uracil/thiamine/allantoin permease
MSINTTYRNDFARYSKKPNSPYVQLIVIPIVFIIVMLFGIWREWVKDYLWGTALGSIVNCAQLDIEGKL